MRILGRRDAAEAVATYAAVLDGSHLWWHVAGHEQVTLRPSDGGADVLVDADPFPLAGLAADRYEVLAGGQRVRVGELPDRRPSRSPLGPDGVTQYDVTTDEGHLGLTRHRATETARLAVVELRGDRLHLRIDPPHGVELGVHLVLLDEGDQTLGLAPLVAHQGHLDALVGVEDLPPGFLGTVRLAIGSPEGWVRIRRSVTDLADPDHAVLLPELPDERRPDRVRARLRWSPDSLLVLRCLDAEAADAPGRAPVTPDEAPMRPR